MNELLHMLERVFGFMERRGNPVALVGGLAVSAHAEPRFTRDIDLVVAVSSDQEAEAIVAAMRGIGYVAVDLVEQEATGRLSTARCIDPKNSQGVVVDLLFASSGVEREIAEAAQVLMLSDSLRGPVAIVPHLVALKLLARSEQRPQDQVDLANLTSLLIKDDSVEVLRLLRLIEERGYARGKSLEREWREYSKRQST